MIPRLRPDTCKPHFKAYSIRHPEYVAGRDSLTSSVGPCGSPRVEGSHFADSSNYVYEHKHPLEQNIKT